MKMVMIMVSAAANDDVADDDDADDDAAGDNVDDAAADGNDAAAAAVDAAAAAAAVDDADTWDKILIALYIGGTPQVLAQVQTRFDPLDTLIWVMRISLMMIVMLMRIKWLLRSHR